MNYVRFLISQGNSVAPDDLRRYVLLSPLEAVVIVHLALWERVSGCLSVYQIVLSFRLIALLHLSPTHPHTRNSVLYAKNPRLLIRGFN